MATFIQLHRPSVPGSTGKERVYINMDLVEAIYPSLQNDNTSIYSSGEDGGYVVIETPQEILALFIQCTRADDDKGNFKDPDRHAIEDQLIFYSQKHSVVRTMSNRRHTSDRRR